MSKHNRERKQLFKRGLTAKQKLRRWGVRIGWGFKTTDMLDSMYLRYARDLRIPTRAEIREQRYYERGA